MAQAMTAVSAELYSTLAVSVKTTLKLVEDQELDELLNMRGGP